MCNFLYLLLAVLGLRCCSGVSPAAESGLSAAPGLQLSRRPGSEVQTQEVRCTGLAAPQPADLPRPGLQPAPAAQAGGFFASEPAGKPHVWFLNSSLEEASGEHKHSSLAVKCYTRFTQTSH